LAFGDEQVLISARVKEQFFLHRHSRLALEHTHSPSNGCQRLFTRC